MKEKMNVPLKNGDEQDALTKAKKYFNWNAGIRKYIKQGYNQRNRKAVKLELNNY